MYLAWKQVSMCYHAIKLANLSYESRLRVRCNTLEPFHVVVFVKIARDGKFCVVVREIGLFFLEVKMDQNRNF